MKSNYAELKPLYIVESKSSQNKRGGMKHDNKSLYSVKYIRYFGFDVTLSITKFVIKEFQFSYSLFC